MDLINKTSEILFQFTFLNFNFTISNYMFALLVCPSIMLLSFYVLIKFKKGKKLFIAIYDMFFKHFSKKFGNEIIPYIPFLFCLFCFVYCFNFFALFPLLYTVTSRFKFTFSISIIVFSLIFKMLIQKHGFKFWNAFIPKNLPVFMMPIMFFIEFGLFLIKPFALAFRLSLNVAIGHIILDTISSFANGEVYAIALVMLILMVIFEILVGLLQSYILVLLSANYMKEILSH